MDAHLLQRFLSLIFALFLLQKGQARQRRAAARLVTPLSCRTFFQQRQL